MYLAGMSRARRGGVEGLSGVPSERGATPGSIPQGGGGIGRRLPAGVDRQFAVTRFLCVSVGYIGAFPVSLDFFLARAVEWSEQEWAWPVSEAFLHMVKGKGRAWIFSGALFKFVNRLLPEFPRQLHGAGRVPSYRWVQTLRLINGAQAPKSRRGAFRGGHITRTMCVNLCGGM